ncbi:hypothetical protein OG349_00905 [Streptomyces sp. NBC_01317]|uniref:hypothetical protein n=1 Tax=Streptomyces sp. NBC_01317 TaxID=2903822 RepID=UPI002E123764|nr:hypothetical protein OG349_00905 [Streptomyces sp. NBC_01317]
MSRTTARDTTALRSRSPTRAKAAVGDEAATVGVSRECALRSNHARPGDPVEAARVIVGLGRRPGAPHRLQPGRTTTMSPASERNAAATTPAAALGGLLDHRDVPGGS